MRVLVCGSRTYTNQNAIMGALHRAHDKKPITAIIHGDARGADRISELWRGTQYRIERYPADWEKYGKRAGYVRNQQMLDEGKPDLVLAFVDKPLAESRGTASMVYIARQAGVETIVYGPSE